MVLALATACGPALVPAPLRMIEEAEARWRANPVVDYRIVVEVERAGERRRAEVVVSRARIERARVSYWSPGRGGWEAPAELNPEQGSPFTPPGLLETVREELLRARDTEVRVAMQEDPPFPRRIALSREGAGELPAPDGSVVVTVKSFEPAPARGG